MAVDARRHRKISHFPRNVGRNFDTADLSSSTMQAQQVWVPKFVAEVVEVNVHLDGYNFQWA